MFREKNLELRVFLPRYQKPSRDALMRNQTVSTVKRNVAGLVLQHKVGVGNKGGTAEGFFRPLT
ncbi:hypothetical protein [Desulfosporosinus fructosivorans]